MKMYTLGIDTSCDETSISVCSGRDIISNVISSQAHLHSPFGGVVPILAKKEHEKNIDIVLFEALRRAKLIDKNKDYKRAFEKISQIAVTTGPGLSIALGVGVNFAKNLSQKYQIDLIPVNHLYGHIYSVFSNNRNSKPDIAITFPYLCLIVSGKHTEIVVLHGPNNAQKLGSTLDDASGEALDKIAKFMGLGYPGGQIVETLAKLGNDNFHKFPLPMAGNNLDFSFSGLKTSFVYFYNSLDTEKQILHINDLCASYQKAVIRAIIYKFKKAHLKTGIKNWIVVGGVSANLALRRKLLQLAKEENAQLIYPSQKKLFGDNAAMIATAGYLQTQVNPKLAYSHDNLTKIERIPRWKIETPYEKAHSELYTD